MRRLTLDCGVGFLRWGKQVMRWIDHLGEGSPGRHALGDGAKALLKWQTQAETVGQSVVSRVGGDPGFMT